MNMRETKNKKKAQQLIEFLLVVPFMVIILGVLTEYAYALNINMTLNEGLKTVTASIYSKIKPEMTQSDIKTILQDNLTTYLSENNAPTNSENNIIVGYFINGQSAVFMASYTYIPAFTLPNVYFKILPDEFNFFTTATVPSAFLGENNYNTSIDSSVLDSIWSSSADFASLDSFNDSKKGIMKDVPGRTNVLFLVPTTAPGLTNPYVLVDWDGTIKKNLAADTYTLDTDDGKLYECSAMICNYNEKFFNYLTDNDYYNIIFVHDDETPSDLNDLSTYWLNPSGTTDISADTVSGILKRSLALVDMSSFSIGNYDNINVSAYNSDISFGNTYTVNTFGSMIFVSGSGDNISNIISTESAPNYNYNFGSKVN